MNCIEETLSGRLKSTFKHYIRHATEHALGEDRTDNDILQVIINLQTSLELLSKLYVLQSQGWKGIVVKALHDKSEADVLLAIEIGSLKTLPYWKIEKIISEEKSWNSEDIQLLKSFHNHRNQIMHLGVTRPPRDILHEAIWFIVRIIHQFDWQDTLTLNDQYKSNNLEALLGSRLYNSLLSYSCYVDEAVDRAYELHADVKLCLQCGNESWAFSGNEDEDFRTCAVCGFRCSEMAIAFIDCPRCVTTEALVYDAMHLVVNKPAIAQCCACKERIPVTRCSACQSVYEYAGQCEFCDNQA